MTGPRILLIDVETAPHKVYAWGLWGQDIALNQIEEPGYTLCFAAKWHGDRKIIFDSIQVSKKREMLEHAHSLLDEADAVMHFNGNKFDMPVLNQEFLQLRMLPPSPYQNIDLLQTARRRFRLPSNKMDYVASHLGVGKKLEHKGMELWKGCMAGDEKAWKVMRAYNIQDVKLLEDIYERFQPWLVSHPNFALFTDETRPVCPTCGDWHLQKRGTKKTKTMIYQQYQCQNCGSWCRDRKNSVPKAKKAGIMTAVVD